MANHEQEALILCGEKPQVQGAITTSCSKCGKTLWMAPSSLTITTSKQLKLVPICMDCVKPVSIDMVNPLEREQVDEVVREMKRRTVNN